MTYRPEIDGPKKRAKYWENPELYRARKREDYRRRRELLNKKRKQRRSENPVATSEARKIYRLKNLEKCKEWDKESYSRRRDKILAQKKAYYMLNQDDIKAKNLSYSKQYYRENKHKWIQRAERIKSLPVEERQRRYRKYLLKYHYDMTPEQYDSILSSQNGVCAICERPPKDGTKLHVDHDHSTGSVRGLLCTRCNNALERLEAFPNWTSKAESYLKRSPR